MRLLDLFCGAGGAAMGYHRAGFEVVGVDIDPQPHYPFEFHQADALTYPLDGFDVIHASPPCQAYSSMSRVHGVGDRHPDLVGLTRDVLRQAGVPWVMENVSEAPMVKTTKMCGSAFGLGAMCHDGVWRQLRRHRWFESDVLLLALGCSHVGEPIGVYGYGGGQFRTVWQGGQNRGYMGSRSERREAMGIDWMGQQELTESIPPAYTEFIGDQLKEVLSAVRHDRGLAGRDAGA